MMEAKNHLTDSLIAQTSGLNTMETKDHLTDSLVAQTLALGAAIAPEVSAASEALYRPMHNPLREDSIARDLRYGPHERHLLDLHHPREVGSQSAPILLFVHGGGFVAGDKSLPGRFYYDNIAAWCAGNGMLGANMTYRLAPQHAWPSAAEDVAAAIDWLREHASKHGGDPERIFLMGHSAGAVHAASYVATRALHQAGGPAIAGCILLSGFYDLVAGPASKAYFGDDPEQYRERSSVRGLVESGVPLMVGVAQADPPSAQKQFVLLQQAFLEQGKPLPHLVYASGHNHYTIAHHLNTSDLRLSDELLRFIRRTQAPAKATA
jgi:acetyl esterase/lipase